MDRSLGGINFFFDYTYERVIRNLGGIRSILVSMSCFEILLTGKPSNILLIFIILSCSLPRENCGENRFSADAKRLFRIPLEFQRGKEFEEEGRPVFGIIARGEAPSPVHGIYVQFHRV